MEKSKLVNVNKKIEDRVVHGYRKIENVAVQGYQKIADTFVDQYLTKEGETIEEAHIRLAKEQQLRKEEHKHKVGK